MTQYTAARSSEGPAALSAPPGDQHFSFDLRSRVSTTPLTTFAMHLTRWRTEMWPRITELEQDSLDTTCRKLNRFLRASPSADPSD